MSGSDILTFLTKLLDQPSTRFFATLFSILTAIFSFLFFKTRDELFKYGIFILVIIILFTATLETIKHQRRAKETGYLGEQIFQELEKWYRKGKINELEFARFVVFLTRPFWLNGYANLTIKMGKLAKDRLEAASAPEGQQYLIPILIDNLGWHIWDYYGQQDRSKAIEYIQAGIQLAKKQNKWSWVYKGYRHLAGIYAESNEIELAEYYLERMKKVIHKQGQKIEQDAGAKIVEGRIYEARANLSANFQERYHYLQNALQTYKQAYKLYIQQHDQERAAKILVDLIRLARETKNDDMIKEYISECRRQAKSQRLQTWIRCEKEFILYLQQNNPRAKAELCQSIIKKLQQLNAGILLEEIKEICQHDKVARDV